MMCKRMTSTYRNRLSLKSDRSIPLGEIQNITTDIPMTAVGNASGMSRRVSSHFFPRKFLWTIIHAMANP